VIIPSQAVKIVVATKPVDFRKGHEGFAAVVQNELGRVGMFACMRGEHELGLGRLRGLPANDAISEGIRVDPAVQSGVEILQFTHEFRNRLDNYAKARQ